MTYQTLEVGLRAFLLQQAGIATLVGARVYPDILPQAPTYPAITLLRIASTRTFVHAGASTLARVRFQIDCWGRTYSQAHDLGDTIRRSMNGYRGSFQGTEVPGAFLRAEHDLYEPDGDVHRLSQDWEVWQQEEAPRWQP